MRPIKVLHVAHSLDIGGTEKVVYDLIRTLNRDVVSSAIACIDHLGHFGAALQHEGYKVFVLGRNPGIDRNLIGRLAQIVREGEFDVIHAQQYTPYFYSLMSCFWLTARVRHRPKLVFTEHGIAHPYKKKLRRLLLNPVLFSFASSINTISRYTKNLLVEYDNYPPHRTAVIPNGVDITRFSQTTDPSSLREAVGLTSTTPVVGVVARLDPVKNHPMLFRAFKTVLHHRPECRLLVIGNGPEEGALKDLAESLEIHDRVLFLGARQDIPSLLQIVDVFALPSFSEGMSAALIESMAAGVPIVATDVGGNSEVVEHNVTGYLIPDNDETAMADRLLDLLRNPETRWRMGEAGRRRAAQLFSLQTMVNAYTDIYMHVAGRRDS